MSDQTKERCPTCRSTVKLVRGIIEQETTGGPGRVNLSIARTFCSDPWHEVWHDVSPVIAKSSGTVSPDAAEPDANKQPGTTADKSVEYSQSTLDDPETWLGIGDTLMGHDVSPVIAKLNSLKEQQLDAEQAWEFLLAKGVPNLDIEREGKHKVTLTELLVEYAKGVKIGQEPCPGCADCEVAPVAPAVAKEPREWRLIVERVAHDAIEIAVSRNELEWDCDRDMGLPEIINDTINVLTGDDIGCEEETVADDPVKCSGAYVRKALAEYAASLSPSRTLLESTVNKFLDDVQIITKQSAYKDHLVDHFKQSEIKHLREIDTLKAELERVTGERDQRNSVAVEMCDVADKERKRAEAVERSLETAREALKAMVERGCPTYGEHEIMRCVYCGGEGHNRVKGDRYSLKHNMVCTLAAAESALSGEGK
jgi:hypothetical protein